MVAAVCGFAAAPDGVNGRCACDVAPVDAEPFALSGVSGSVLSLPLPVSLASALPLAVPLAVEVAAAAASLFLASCAAASLAFSWFLIFARL